MTLGDQRSRTDSPLQNGAEGLAPGDAPDAGTAGATRTGFRGGRQSSVSDEIALRSVVASLRPVKVFQPATSPIRPAGDAPGPVIGAAVLCALLTLPLLVTAGSLFADLTNRSTLLGGLLSLSTLGLTAMCVLAAVWLVRRGTPLPALFIALVTFVATVSSGIRLSQGTFVDLVTFAVWLIFALLAGLMLGLLRTRLARRWLLLRNREWIADRPPAKVRRIPAVRLRRRPRRVGRHTRRRTNRLIARRRRLRAFGRDFVGRHSPDYPSHG